METITFHDLYAAHSRHVFRFALSLCGNEADAEDITMTVFLRAWAGAPLQAPSARSYLLAIARNLYVDGRRKAWRETAIEPAHEQTQTGPSNQERRLELQEALRALGELPEAYRTPLRMWAAGGLAYHDIAAALGCSSAVVKVRIHRAQQMLAQKLGR
jgi:RNA polymerase sigma-70 factor (ECF subfamily)